MKISSEDFRQRLLPILCAQGIGLACGVASVRLVSQLVAPSDYGAYGVFTTLATVGAGVVYAGLLKFVSRHWQGTADRSGLVREIAAATWRKIPWLLAVSAVATLYVAPGQKVLYGGLLAASAFLLTLAQFAQAALQAAREHWRDLGISAGMSVTRSFAPALLYAFTGAGLVALLSGFLLHAAVGALLGLQRLRRWWPDRTAPAAGRILTPVYEGPRFVALALAGWMLAGLNRWIMAWFFGSEQTGYFILAANLGSILPMIAGMVLLQYVQPQWFAATTDSINERQQLLKRVDRVALTFTLAGLALAAAVHAAMPWLTGTLVSERYADAAAFVFMTGCSTVAATTGLYYHAMLLAAKKERDCSTADLGGAACLIAGGVLSAAAGLTWFKTWLIVSAAVPWLVNRNLARRALFRAP